MKDQEIIFEVKRCIEIEAASINSLLSSLNEEQIVKVARALMDCEGKVILSGCGTFGYYGLIARNTGEHPALGAPDKGLHYRLELVHSR